MPINPDIIRLRSRIAALEGVADESVAGVAPLGLAALDGELPWGGLPLGCLHEVAPAAHGDGIEDGGALAFSSFLMGRLAAQSGKPVLWVMAGDEPYAPGLAALGLPPGRLVMVRAWRAAQALWAVEEGLRCRALAGVLAEVWRLDLTAARRLQLAARNSGVPALLLNHGETVGPAVTRWRAGSIPSQAPPGEGVGAWSWRLELLRCRGRGVDDRGMVAAWDVEWDDETRGLRLAAAAGDRTAAPEWRRAAG
jgi:protein ImuA